MFRRPELTCGRSRARAARRTVISAWKVTLDETLVQAKEAQQVADDVQSKIAESLKNLGTWKRSAPKKVRTVAAALPYCAS